MPRRINGREVCTDKLPRLIGRRMRRNRPALFKGRYFEAEIIILCVAVVMRVSKDQVSRDRYFPSLPLLLVPEIGHIDCHAVAVSARVFLECRTGPCFQSIGLGLVPGRPFELRVVQ